MKFFFTTSLFAFIIQLNRGVKVDMFIEELVPNVNLETTEIEFKGLIEEGPSQSGSAKEIGWIKTLAAFANTSGGKLYIGVDNKSHKVLSLDHQTADHTVLMIHRQIHNRIEPPIDYEIDPIPCPGSMPTRYVLCVSVKPGRNLPVTVHEEGLLGIYVRTFGRTELATTEQIRDMVLMSDHVPYDQPFTDENFDPKRFGKLYEHIHSLGKEITEKELISIGFLSSDRKLSKGALLFADDCRDSRTKVVVTSWPGLTKGSSIITASEEYTGNLLEMIELSISFVRNHSNNGFIKEAEGRSEYISFPPRSVMEGVVNAVGHRNYFMQGCQIEINVFSDRLEITSPGSLLGVRELKKEKNISAIIPRRRNEVICGILEVCNYMEEKGSGFDKIEADYSGYGEAYRPYISSDASSFTLTLPDLTWRGGMAEDTGALPEVYTESVLRGKNDLHILAYCYNTAHTTREIAEELQIKPSTYFRQSILARLVEQGLLYQLNNEKTALFQSNPNKVFLKSR